MASKSYQFSFVKLLLNLTIKTEIQSQKLILPRVSYIPPYIPFPLNELVQALLTSLRTAAKDF